MDPIVEKYNKVFNPEVMASANSVREAHVKIKERLGKFVPMEDGVLKMVCENLPSPEEAQNYRMMKLCPALGNPNLI